MKFALNIDCSNAAFAPVHDDASEAERYREASAELRRILTALGDPSEGLDTIGGNVRSGFVRDFNGNRCGQWSLNSDDEREPPQEDDDGATAERLLRDYGPGSCAAIVGAIDAFDRECEEREHTDTDAAWVLLRAIRRLAK